VFSKPGGSITDPPSLSSSGPTADSKTMSIRGAALKVQRRPGTGPPGIRHNQRKSLPRPGAPSGAWSLVGGCLMLGSVHDISGQPSGGGVELGALLALLHRPTQGLIMSRRPIGSGDTMSGRRRRGGPRSRRRSDGVRRSPATACQAAQRSRLRSRPCCGSGAPRTASERSAKVGHAMVPTGP
jgi:hypothetical protein